MFGSLHKIMRPRSSTRLLHSTVRVCSSSRFDEGIDRKFTGSVKYDKYLADRDSDKRKYLDIIPCWVADMDFKSPECISRAIIDWTKKVGLFGYTGPDLKTKTSMLNYLRAKHGLADIKPNQLVFLPGLVVGLNIMSNFAASMDWAMMTCYPVYPPFLTCARNADVTSLAVPLQYSDKYKHYTFDFAAMEKEIENCEQKVGVFVLCNPHNPVGRVYTREELEELAKFCIKHDLIVVSDEIHCELILDKSAQHVPFLSLCNDIPGLRERTIVFHAPSKTFNIAGLAVAFSIIQDTSLRGKIKNQMRGIVSDINVFGYLAMQTAYEDPECEEYRDELVNYLNRNVSDVKAFAEKAYPLVKLSHEQQATYLVWLDCRELLQRLGDQQNVMKWLQSEAGIGLNDGNHFGPGNMLNGYVRMNVACPNSTLKEILARFEEALVRNKLM